MKTLLNYNIPKDRLSFIVRERRGLGYGRGGGGGVCWMRHFKIVSL